MSTPDDQIVFVYVLSFLLCGAAAATLDILGVTTGWIFLFATLYIFVWGYGIYRHQGSLSKRPRRKDFEMVQL
jgi:hypothetical protein